MVARGVIALALMPTDLMTSIEVAAAVGYEAIDLWVPTIVAYLDQGGSPEAVAEKLAALSVRPSTIASISRVDLPPGPERDEVVRRFRRMCEFAQRVGCPVIQVLGGPLGGTASAAHPWSEVRAATGRGLREVADIASDQGLVVAVEPIAGQPVATIGQVLEVIGETNRPNVGVLVDTFQVFASEGPIDEVRQLSAVLMPTVHLGDCFPRQGNTWTMGDRSAMPGDGIAPLADIVDAILDTGYDGVFSDEIGAARYADWSRLDLARALKAKGDAVLREVTARRATWPSRGAGQTYAVSQTT